MIASEAGGILDLIEDGAPHLLDRIIEEFRERDAIDCYMHEHVNDLDDKIKTVSARQAETFEVR